MTAGFEKSPILWSFTPLFYVQSNGQYWSKLVDYPDGGRADEIEIGVVLNDKSQAMSSILPLGS